MNRREVLEKLKSLKEKKQRIMARQAREKAENRIYFFEPLESTRRDNPYQQRVLDLFHRGKKIVVYPGPNKLGKTAQACCIVGSWVVGYEPWNPVPREHPMAVKARGGYYHRSSLGIDPPVRLRITAENWEDHVIEVIVPEMKKWLPPAWYETKKNNVGAEAHWTFFNGSTIEIMTHKQDFKAFESWLGDGWWPDEPPPRAIFSAMSRGIFMRGGKVLMTMTPLSEPWVLDHLIMSGRPDVGVVDNLNLWDNPMLYEPDLAALFEAGLTMEETDRFFDLQIRWAWGDADGEPIGFSKEPVHA